MKRKGLVRLLGIVLALMLPMSAVAQGSALDMLAQASAQGKEIVSTITFEPGKTLAADQVVADMSAATAIRLSKLSGGFGGFSILLGDVEVISAKMHVQTDGVYVQSETLGEKPLYFSWEDVQKGIAEAMRSSGADQASIDQFSKGFMNGLSQGFTMGMNGAQDGMQAMKGLTDEQIKEKITQAMGGDDSMVKWIESIEAKKVVTTGEFTLEGSDVADTKTELLVTKEDMAALYDMAYVQKQMLAQVKAEDASLTDDQAQAKVASLIADIKAEIDKSGAEMPIVFYTKGTEEWIAVDAKFTGTFTPSKTTTATDSEAVTVMAEGATETAAATEQPATPVKVDLAAVITRKTMDNGRTYSFTMTANQDGVKKMTMIGSATKIGSSLVGTLMAADGEDQPLMAMDMAADYTDVKHVTANMAMTAYTNGTSQAVTVAFDQTVGDMAVDSNLSISSGASVDVIKANPETSLLGTVKVNTVVQEDSGAYASLKEVTPDAAVQPMKMSETELQAFFGAVQSTGMQTLYKVLGNLPPSASALFGGAMGN